MYAHSVSKMEAGLHVRWFAPLHQAITMSHQRHIPCGEAEKMRGCGEGKQSHVAEGWQGTDGTSMTPRRGVRYRLLQHADAGSLCAAFFVWQNYLVVVVLWAPGQHAHTQHAHAHTAHHAPAASTVSLRMVAV